MKSPYRQRFNVDSFLPRFSPENVTIDNARIDKLVMYFPNMHIAYRNMEQLGRYKLLLKSTSGLFKPYTLSTIGLEFSERYLIAGHKLTFRCSSNHPNKAKFYPRLELNPTAFYSNLNLCADSLDSCNSDYLLRNSNLLEYRSMYTLDNSSNVLSRKMWTATASMECSLRFYFSALKRLFEEAFGLYGYRNSESEIIDAIPPELTEENAQAELDWRGWNIYRCEVYWDFYDKNAAQTVRNLKRSVYMVSV
jgi:hypothetical protein